MTSAGHIQLFCAAPNSPVRWRLLSGNNRDAGRGADAYSDIESCRIAVKELQSILGEVRTSMRRSTLNEWVWQASLHNHVIASAGRGFDRLIRCEQAMSHFLVNFRDAEIGAVVMVTNARRW